MQSKETPQETETHVFLTIEIPSLYTKDMLPGGALYEFKDEYESESDFILDCCGQPSVVKLKTEISGEKEGAVIEVWGSVCSASLGPATRGYGPGPHLAEEQLEANGWALMTDDEKERADHA